MKLDGSNPTILYAYGGFQVSMTPSYSGTIGKLWLEHGGVYVLANIRGGGEFGPAWHEAGLKTNRQRDLRRLRRGGEGPDRAQDHLAAPARHPGRLQRRPADGRRVRLSIRSCGTRSIIQVPLLDMLRFEQIGAGASWVGEYGSVSVPAERAFLAEDLALPEPEGRRRLSRAVLRAPPPRTTG